MKYGLSAGERVLRLLEFVVPAVTYMRVRKRLLDNANEAPDTRDEWSELLSISDNAIEMANEIYVAEAGRIDGLEAKLRSSLAYMTPFVPLAAAGLVASLDPFCISAFSLSVLTAIQLLGAYLVTLTGTEARRRNMLTNEALREVVPSVKRQAAWAAEKLYAAEGNQWIGIDLSNAIYAVSRSLARVIVLLTLAGVVLFLKR